jgi:hypothetical protein
MIHVNVDRHRSPSAHPDECVVETSTDGGGWKTQYIVSYTEGDDPGQPKREAEHIARVMGVAWTYAGVEWRGTSFGYSL